ncbi:MAG TPA: dephospho-CoA kinase [Spirochaetota bacterium]
MKIGVTGNYASGKGTVCSMFEKLGAIVIDTDLIAREVVQAGSPVLTKIVSAFGPGFLSPEGTLDRKKFGAYIFESPSRVQLLNSIIHPAILEITLKRAPDDENNIYMINAPVLFEASFDTYMDYVIVVSAADKQSLERGIKRDGISKEEIEKRLANQISLNEKIRRADYIIDNSKDLDFTRKQVCEIWNNLINRKIVP